MDADSVDESSETREPSRFHSALKLAGILVVLWFFFRPPSSIEVIQSDGNPVDITARLNLGGPTIVMFTSSRCGACPGAKRKLGRLIQRRGEFEAIAIDIDRPGSTGIDFGSPIAKQNGVTSLPAFVVYGPNRNKLLSGEKAYQQVTSWFGGMRLTFISMVNHMLWGA